MIYEENHYKQGTFSLRVRGWNTTICYIYYIDKIFFRWILYLYIHLRNILVQPLADSFRLIQFLNSRSYVLIKDVGINFRNMD